MEDKAQYGVGVGKGTGKEMGKAISRLKGAVGRMQPTNENLQEAIAALCLTVEELAQQINDLREDQKKMQLTFDIMEDQKRDRKDRG